MPGARPVGFRAGDSAELLAEFVLSALAFTTRVPRQEDVGHDLLCVLAKPEGAMLLAGGAFTVQVKSGHDDLVFERDYEVRWLKNLELPFLVAVVTRATLTVEVYSTWNLLNGILYREARRVILRPGAAADEFALPSTDEQASEQVIPLGRPILRMTAADMMDAGLVAKFRQVLEEWLRFDNTNIVNRRAGMFWVTGPAKYETNTPLPDEKHIHMGFFFHAQNFEGCVINAGRSATALRLVIRQRFGPEAERVGTLAVHVEALDRFLRAYADALEVLPRKVLGDHLGSNYLDG